MQKLQNSEVCTHHCLKNVCTRGLGSKKDIHQIQHMLCLYSKKLPALLYWIKAFEGCLEGVLGQTLTENPKTHDLPYTLYCGLCRANSPLASFIALQLLVTSSRACSALARTSVCKRLEGRKQSPRPGAGGEERKDFVKNSRDGKRQVGHHGSYSLSSSSLQACQTALRFFLYFRHFCIIRGHTALSSVIRKTHVISYLSLDRYFNESIKGAELELTCK